MALTWRELEQLVQCIKTKCPEYLDFPVSVYDSEEEEYFEVDHYDFEPHDDVLSEGEPYFTIKDLVK